MKYLQRISWFPPEQKVIFRDQHNHKNWVSFKSIRQFARHQQADIWWCSDGKYEFVMLKLPD